MKCDTISSYISGSIQSISFFMISNTITINNSCIAMTGFQRIKILNCTFLKNKEGITLKDNDEIIINQTTFEEIRGTAIYLISYRNILTVDYCKFAFNIAVDSGAAINSQVDKL